MIRLSRISGDFPEDFRQYCVSIPSRATTSRWSGGRWSTGRTQQIDDVLADPEYGRRDLQRLAGYRTLLAAPMIVDDEVVGVLSVWRTEVDPFDERDRELLEAFAVQAAIVLRQVELLRRAGGRGAELATKVEQLEALREVGEAVSSSLDLDEVLHTIVGATPSQLTGTDGGSIMEYDEHERRLPRPRGLRQQRALLERLRGVKIRRDSTLVGPGRARRRPLEVADLADAVDRDPHLRDPVRRRVALGARRPDAARRTRSSARW